MGRLWGAERCGLAGALIVAAGLVIGICGLVRDGLAYTAAGDRVFAATALLPQIAPGDEFYTWGWTVPLAGGPVGAPSRVTNFGVSYDKTITERLGVGLVESWFRRDRVGAGSLQGLQNLATWIKYWLINDHAHEFALSLGVMREWGGTGARRVGAFRSGQTAPRLYFGKGLGDLDIGYLRPLGVVGFAGYEFADAPPRPDLVTTGFGVQYSMPYLQSKVQSFDLPGLIRRLTPMTEVLFTTPAGRSFGARTTVLIAPGVSYAGDGWEFLVEALVPATRATGTGVGVRAQLYLSLDFLFPETIGRPLLSGR